jgi:hypothetical protein
MTDSLGSTHQRLPVSNYGSAVARALEWLGDRYLLAKPINAGMRPRGPATEVGHREGPVRELERPANWRTASTPSAGPGNFG